MDGLYSVMDVDKVDSFEFSGLENVVYQVRAGKGFVFW